MINGVNIINLVLLSLYQAFNEFFSDAQWLNHIFIQHEVFHYPVSHANYYHHTKDFVVVFANVCIVTFFLLIIFKSLVLERWIVMILEYSFLSSQMLKISDAMEQKIILIIALKCFLSPRNMWYLIKSTFLLCTQTHEAIEI